MHSRVPRFRSLSSAALFFLCLAAGAAAEEAPLWLGGVGGVYFYAEPGELVVDIQKRDLNSSRKSGLKTELHAILAGPDRQVLGEATIPDDGRPSHSGPGPIQQRRLAAKIERAGVYVLNVMVSQDPYGDDTRWNFRSNCPHYIIETARGHKDERHQEPIVLDSADRSAEVCFSPRAKAFDVELTGLPAKTSPVRVTDAKGALLATLTVSDDGRASHHFAADPQRSGALWRLHLPSAHTTVNIDGVTRWDEDDLHPDMACWTDSPGAWFPLLDNRYLILPYQRFLYGSPGKSVEFPLVVRNDSTSERAVKLALEFGGERWPVHLSVDRVVLPSRGAATVIATATAPADGIEQAVHVRATLADDSGFSTYSTLRIRGGIAPATQPMPIALTPYRHENEQFGYAPNYPTENQIYFDLRNQPFESVRDGMAALNGGHWTTTRFHTGLDSIFTKIAFDNENWLYTIATGEKGDATIFYSKDNGRTFATCALPFRASIATAYDFEVFTGQNPPANPPAILRFTRTAKDAKVFWRSLHDIELFLPKKEGDRIVLGDPILITRLGAGIASHSGVAAAVVSRGSKVHMVWGEATDPGVHVPGVPTYVATYDRETRKLSTPVLVGYGPPANDIHNTPSITIDSRGILHVLCGTHGAPFPYTRSLEPNDSSRWTPAVPISDQNQTYIGLVCGPDDTLHVVYRIWHRNTPPFPASRHATLAYQRKRPGHDWETPRILVEPPFSEYSVFYHRLTIDRRGRLFISYDLWSTYWFYRNDRPVRPRALLFSPDNGDSWRLASDQDLQPPAGP